MNDLWDSGIQDDKFSLIAKMNEKCQIAVKTPVGVTDRFELEQIEMQGTKFSNIKCSIQVDTLGKECYTSSEGLFLYKKCVYVPPLGKIDDVASFAFSGPEAIKTNAIINAKIESKKLEFGPSKCYNIHLGKNQDTQSILKILMSVWCPLSVVPNFRNLLSEGSYIVCTPLEYDVSVPPSS